MAAAATAAATAAAATPPEGTTTGPLQKGRGVQGQYVYWITMARPKPETVAKLGICVPTNFDRGRFSEIMVSRSRPLLVHKHTRSRTHTRALAHTHTRARASEHAEAHMYTHAWLWVVSLSTAQLRLHSTKHV